VKLAVLGSGSRGNAVALRVDGVSLLVDAGFGPRALLRRAEVAGLPLEPLAGIVLTHEHGDHARGAAALARRAGCPLVGTAGTLRVVGGARTEARLLAPFGETLRLGPFTVAAARTPHDAREPVAVAVTDAQGRRVAVAWDLGRATGAVRHLLRGVHVLVIEANHDEVMLRTGPYPAAVRQRIGGSTGHLSNRLAADLAAEACSPALEAVILAHVSELCNDGETALRTVRSALRARGFRGAVLVAGQRDPLPAFTLREASQLPLPLTEVRREDPPPSAPPSPPSPPIARSPTP
jgi:phosphoribosyl 1,2-cyclic phosphodiesterase